MINRYILEVLQSLQSDEWKDLQYYLESPYFNRSFNAERLTSFYYILFKSSRNGALESLTKEHLFASLFPNSPFLEGKLDKLMTEFKKLLSDFLITQRFRREDNEAARQLTLAIDFRYRGLKERYLQALEKAREMTEVDQVESLNNYSLLLNLSLEEHEWYSQYNTEKGDLNIPEVIENLEAYYCLLKTELLNRLIIQNRSTLLPDHAQKILDEQWSIPVKVLDNGIMLNLVNKIHDLYLKSTPTQADFQSLLETLQANSSKISQEHLKEYYGYLRNLCLRLAEAERQEHLRPVLQKIYADNLERGYFYFEGKIQPNAVLNINHYALSANEIEWAKTFVEKHKNMILGDNETLDFYRLNKALYLFAEKKYEEVLEVLPFGSSYSTYHLTARRLELRAYYELDSDLLYYKIDAFKMFISRAGKKDFPKDRAEWFVNFINFLRQLSTSPRGVRDPARSAQLIKRINEKKHVADRYWLLEKARELGEKKR